jgi:hypothetical protein
MKTEIGEYIIGAYLKIVIGCDYVDYNVRPSEKGLEGLGELDVIGIKLEKGHEEIYLCEVTTHLDGLVYGSSYSATVDKIAAKFDRQRKYKNKYIPDHFKAHYMFWSPVVLPEMERKLLSEAGSRLKDLELVINKDYFNKIEELKKLSKDTTKDFGNPFFRTLQILGHVEKRNKK